MTFYRLLDNRSITRDPVFPKISKCQAAWLPDHYDLITVTSSYRILTCFPWYALFRANAIYSYFYDSSLLWRSYSIRWPQLSCSFYHARADKYRSFAGYGKYAPGYHIRGHKM